ncbi:DUF1840 domain-containing protein [Legionella nagasakiensis]|uniref:DUF1840 domain-containing protein n=1 Tax=Legionella nagasakiensis TaxID=535290 RepID=UPI0010553843|nr:DUF1840 domain-containing protein [Legionella nagasakiensis]
MLVTFSCDAHENITMFGDVAKRLIKMMGHSGTIPSAILAEDVPEALVRLQQAIEIEKKKTVSNEKLQDNDDEEMDVSIEHRAWPLIELLRDAVKAKCNVMWK